MTAPQVIRAQREENLDGFEAALTQLVGVTEEHANALRRSATVGGGRAFYPKDTDLVGQSAYTAAALRAIAEHLLAQQEA